MGLLSKIDPETRIRGIEGLAIMGGTVIPVEIIAEIGRYFLPGFP